MRSLASVLAAAFVTLCCAGAARADAAAEARVAFERGVAHMDAERWQDALAELERSLAIRPTQVALLNLGLCLSSLGRRRDALTTFQRFEREHGATATADRRAVVAEELVRLRAQLSFLRVQVDRPGADVRVDGAAAGSSPLADEVVLDPGAHEVVVRLDGFGAVAQRVDLRAGQRKDLAIALVPTGVPRAPSALHPPPEPRTDPPPPPPPPAVRRGPGPAWFWASAGLAAAATTTTAVLGTLALVENARYEDSDPRTRADQDAGKRLVLFTDVALGTAVVAATVALVLYTQTSFGPPADGDHDEPASLRLAVGPTDLFAVVVGAF